MREFDISVAIPAYNRAEYVAETLDSVLGQTLPPAEVVVVNDGSTDDTTSVLARYDSRIRVIDIENSGAGAARKTAADATSGNWLAFCDSDDIWLPNHLERRVRLLQQYPEINFSFSDLEPFGPASIPGKTYFSDAPEGWWAQFDYHEKTNCFLMGTDAYIPFLDFNPGSPVTTLMTRDLYDRIGGIDPRYSRMVAEDADMARKAILVGNVLCDRMITAKQRRHEGNMSSQVVMNLIGKCRILEDHIRLGVAPSSHEPELRKAINKTMQDAFLAAYYAKDRKQATRILGKLGWTRITPKNMARYVSLLLGR